MSKQRIKNSKLRSFRQQNIIQAVDILRRIQGSSTELAKIDECTANQIHIDVEKIVDLLEQLDLVDNDARRYIMTRPNNI
jgi:hypothetical protein